MSPKNNIPEDVVKTLVLFQKAWGEDPDVFFISNKHPRVSATTPGSLLWGATNLIYWGLET